MLVIRLHRVGKTNQPSFRIVVVDKRRSAAAGRFCEEVGSINRAKKESKLNKDRIKYWLSQGAQPSASIHNLLVSEKLISEKKIAVHKQPKKKEGEAATAAAKATETKA
jgi:small subunit ribosomal protein S16